MARIDPDVRLLSRELTVVQMHGEPGSGKSTLAGALGRALGAVVLDKDIVKSALLRTSIAEAQAAPAAYEAFFDLARSLLRQRSSVILDSPAFWPAVQEKSLNLAREARASYAMIECVCPDRGELVRRLAGRDVQLSEPREPLDLAPIPGTAAPSCPRLILDTTRPLHELLTEAISFVRSRPTAQSSQTGGRRRTATPATSDQRRATSPATSDRRPATRR